MNPTLRTGLAVLCIVVIAVCSILLVAWVSGRARVADLTEEKLYTLSDGTLNIVGKLNQPIKLRLYYARTAARKGPEMIRFWNNYYLYVRDLLEEYVRRSGGKLTLEIIDPRPFTDDEEEAIRYGVKRFQITQEEAFFFGMVASTELGKDEVIEFFEPDRQEFVEYDVSKMLSALMQRDKRKIGVIANVPIMGTDMSPYMMQMLRMQGRQPEKPWSIVGHIQQQYEMEKVDLKDADEPAIPNDIDFLMVVHPKGLDERTQYAIDQYVMKGGKLMVFVDPHCLQDPPMSPQPQVAMSHKASSDLNGLLDRWGVRMEEGKIAVDRKLGIPVSLRPNASPEKLPTYLSLRDEQLNQEEVITQNLHQLRMLYPGVLTKVDAAGTELRALIQTTDTGSTWKPGSPFELQYPDIGAINKAIKDGTEPITLACILTGKLKTNFPGGIEVEAKEEKKEGDGLSGDKEDDDKKGDEGEAGKKGQPTQPATKAAAKPATAAAAKPTTKAAAKPATKASAKPTTAAETTPEEPKEPEKTMKRLTPLTEAAEGAVVIVVADVDFLTDMLCYQNSFFGMAISGDNSSFVFNALDYLSGSQDLIKIRSRGRYSRPFTVVDAIEQETEAASAAEIKDIQKQIDDDEEELRKLGGSATTEQDVRLLQSETLDKRRKIEARARDARLKLRKLQAKRRAKVEALGGWLKLANMFAAPLIILGIAVALALFRWVRAKHYAARRD